MQTTRSLSILWLLFSVSSSSLCFAADQQPFQPGTSDAETDCEILRMFVSYFGRPPAPEGLDYYSQAIERAGGDCQILIDDFARSSESAALFAGLSETQQVERIIGFTFGYQGSSAQADPPVPVSAGTSPVEVAFLMAANEPNPTLDARETAAQAFVQALRDYQRSDSCSIDRDFARAYLAKISDPASANQASRSIDDSIAAMCEAAKAEAETTQQVYTMFAGYFGRPPAPEGLEYYSDQMARDGGEYGVLVDDFYRSSESQTIYGSLTTEEQVDQVFNFLFSRQAEPAGRSYWTDTVNSGAISVAEMAYTVAYNADAADSAVLEAKISASEAFVAALEGYRQTASCAMDPDFGRDFLASIDSAAASASARSVIDSTVATMCSGAPFPSKHPCKDPDAQVLADVIACDQGWGCSPGTLSLKEGNYVCRSADGYHQIDFVDQTVTWFACSLSDENWTQCEPTCDCAFDEYSVGPTGNTYIRWTNPNGNYSSYEFVWR